MEPSLYEQFYAVERTHWWAVGMRGVFHMLLEEALRGTQQPRLLDVGCGTGITLEEFRRHGWIFGVDLTWQALRFCRRRDPGVRVVQGDLSKLPIASDSLDAVLALDVVEHLEDDSAALQEIHRVLRSRGVALINVPAFASLWSEKDTANHHLRRYTRPALRRTLQRCGFRIERITYTNAMLFPAIWCARRIQRLARRPWNSTAEYHPATWVNGALVRLLGLEREALRHLNLPFGTSVTCVARRIP